MTFPISLAIPCYRESERLEKFLSGLAKILQERKLPVSIQVVDDGSGPKYAESISRLIASKQSSFRDLQDPLLLPNNLGKGGAIYAAWDSAPPEVEWLAFSDADGATPPEEIARVFTELLAQPELADAWLGSRIKMLGKKVDRTLKRHIVGRVYATMASAATGLAVYDSQCGFKIVRRDSYLAIRSNLTEQGFGFDMELLSHLHRSGARLLEVPVDWSDVPGGKVNLFSDSWRMLVSLLRLRQRLNQSAKFSHD